MRQVPLSSHAIAAVAWFEAIRIGWVAGANKMPPMIMPEKNTAATVKTGTPSFRREGSDPCSCLSKSSQSRRSMENLLYRKSPHENPEKGPAFPVSPRIGCFKKLMHKTLIREIDENCHPNDYVFLASGMIH
jgi:hypothetical protein